MHRRERQDRRRGGEHGGGGDDGGGSGDGRGGDGGCGGDGGGGGRGGGCCGGCCGSGDSGRGVHSWRAVSHGGGVGSGSGEVGGLSPGVAALRKDRYSPVPVVAHTLLCTPVRTGNQSEICPKRKNF